MRGASTFTTLLGSAGLLLFLLPAPSEAKRPPPSALETSIAAVDAEAARLWRAASVEPAPDAGDHEFLRRVTLDIAGRIPNVGEIEAFVADANPNKRAQVIDRLLASDDYASYWGDVYTDLVIGREARFRRPLADAPEAYFQESFASGKAMDVMAAELLTATGELDDNGAAGLIVAHRIGGGSIDTLAGKAARTFLGTQIQCAQCHDHPYDKRFKKRDFREFAAYFAGVRSRRVQDPILGVTFEVVDAKRLPYSPPTRVIERRAKKQPYIVEPRYFGRQTPPRPGESRRQVLARTIVADPAFAKVTVNRTWSHLFGRPLVSPWDDLSAGESNLLNKLAADFAKHGFDHRRLLRVITRSVPYQRASVGGRAPATNPDLVEGTFARASVRPLSAGQLFYSQLLATGVHEAKRGTKRWIERTKRVYLFTFEDDEAAEVDTFTGSVPQALLLRNGVLTNQATRGGKDLIVGRILAATKDPQQRLDWLFLVALGRKPTAAEGKVFRAHIDAAGPTFKRIRAAHEDIMHALLTSTEFATNH